MSAAAPLDPKEAAARLSRIRLQMGEAAKASGRDPSEVALVAVSKTVPAPAVKALLEAGQKDFGESYIQEARDKIPELPLEAVWHFIGHLQANKAKFVPPLFSTLHSLDSIALAAELQKRLAASERILGVYVEVNVSGEDQKSGIEPGALASFLDSLSQYPLLIPLGLMTMPPYDPDPEASRPYFSALYNLREKVCPALKGLSMGMSGDFQVAISEGATVIRVGTALFGERS